VNYVEQHSDRELQKVMQILK